MTDLPSCELVQRFMHEAGFPVANPDDEMVFPAAKFMKLASRLIQHGADQELEACCEWLGDAPVVYNDNGDLHPGAYLRDARRSKMRSLKEQALLAIDTAVADGRLSPDVSNVVRRALEALPE